MIDVNFDIYLFLSSARMFLDGFGYERALTLGHFSFTENWKQLELGSDIPLVFHGGAQTTNNSNWHRVYKHVRAQRLLPLPLVAQSLESFTKFYLKSWEKVFEGGVFCRFLNALPYFRVFESKKFVAIEKKMFYENIAFPARFKKFSPKENRYKKFTKI